MSFSYTNNPETEPFDFLQEIAEHYANASFFKNNPDDILAYAEKVLSGIPDIATHINRQNFYSDIQDKIAAYKEKTKNDKYRLNNLFPKEDDGDNEFIYTFKWNCTNDVFLMQDWFRLMYRLGGDPSLKNVSGKTAFDTCQERMLLEGFSQKEVDDFLNSLSR